MRAAAHTLRALPRISLWPSPRARLWLAVLLVVGLALACLYLLWFRDSDLVRVEKVTITGLSVDHAPRIRSALTAAARDMTTLHVREDDLERAVSGFPVVQELRISTDFPHGLRIRVVERRPVAVLLAPGQRVPVAADGTVLRGVEAPATLPPVPVSGRIPRHRLGEPEAMRTVTVIAAAPDPLAARIDAVREEGAKGLVADLDGGPDVILGDSGRLEAKWAAATRVLADPEADGAAYVDVRLPERPVAGGLAPEPSADQAAPQPTTPPAPAPAPTVPSAPQQGAVP